MDTFYMQNSNKYPHPAPINELFISSQMRVGVPKHEINKNAEVMKPHYCPYQMSAMSTYPPPYTMEHQMPVPVQPLHDPKFMAMQKKRSEYKLPKRSKEKNSSSVEEIKEKDKRWQHPDKREPPFIISLSSAKGARNPIP
jgi:hypothetical protein